MDKAKPVRRRGRPPKYILDDEGREVVGLSYNPTNNMYYATGTNPRYYVCSGKYPKEQAIKYFFAWKENHPYTPDELEEQRKRNEIHKQAIRLIEEGCLDDLIEKKARGLIKNDNVVKEELLKRAKELVTGERSASYTFDNHGFFLRDKFEEEIKSFITEKAKEFVAGWVCQGEYDSMLWERAYDLITDDPVKAAKVLGIPGIAYIEKRHDMPLPWSLAWDIFYSHKDESQFHYDSDLYLIVRKGMNYLDPRLLSKIKYAEFYDAFENENDPSYIQIPKMDRLEILEDVFRTVKKAGYNQVDPILKLIDDFSRRL